MDRKIGPERGARRLLLLNGRSEGLKSLAAPAAEYGTVDQRAELSAVPLLSQYDVLVADYDALSDEDRARIRRSFSVRLLTRLVLVSTGKHDAELAELFSTGSLRQLHVLDGSDPDSMAQELSMVLRRHSGQNAGGLAPLLKTYSFHRFKVANATEKAAVVQDVLALSRKEGVQARLSTMLSNVADELISNALIHGPRPAGSPPSAAARAEALPPGRSVEVTFGYDGLSFGLSVADPFGTLTDKALTSRLARYYARSGKPVAQDSEGLGLLSTLDSVSGLVADLQPGRRTELIALLRTRKTLRDFAARVKSFHLFSDG